MSGNEDGAPGAPGPEADRAAFSLRRWSQRKHQAAREARVDSLQGAGDPAPSDVAAPMASTVPQAAPSAVQVAPTSAVALESRVAGQTAPAAPADRAATSELPPIETLTADSNFAPFMRPGVDATLRREALKKLLHDPRFNVMDGLDVYIDDYTKSTPIEPSLARELLARLHPHENQESDKPADDPADAKRGGTPERAAGSVQAKLGPGDGTEHAAVPVEAAPGSSPAPDAAMVNANPER